MLRHHYNINELKINSWLDEIEADRTKLFNDIKTNAESDNNKESKIKSLENIQKTLITYKKILTKEKNDK